ncbi:hypothetical protein Tco_0786114, partial [Tanacetum coccineum]
MVGGRMHRLHSWDDTVDRVRNRLSKWKMKMLSSGGRLTLVKSVLGSMPIFHMSLFKVPAEKGGLGVSSLYALNRGLLFKWVWRFLTQGSSLWARVIKAIHGMDGSIGDIRIGNFKSCWSSIINEINVLSSKGIKLMNYLRITLGNGVSTRLWDESWHIEGILKDRFPRIYALENCKSVTVGDKLAHQTLSHSFRRLPRGGIENAKFAEFCVLRFAAAGCPRSRVRPLDVDGEWLRWWEVPDMEIDSYATWKGRIVTIRMASITKLMFE